MSNLIPGVAATKAAKKVVKKLPKKKKMRQPTKKELQEGRIAGTAFGGPRALTPGDKKGEMVYSRPSYRMGGKRVQVKSDVKGGRGTPPPRVKPTPSKGQIHSAANKKKIDKAAKAANKRSAEANKYNPTKEEMVGSKNKRPATFGEIGNRQKKEKDIDMGYTTVALNSGGSIADGLQGKNKIPTIKPKPGPHKVRPPGYKPPKIKKSTGPKSEFESFMEKTQPKKYGGKINYRMGGGQVVDSSYD